MGAVRERKRHKHISSWSILGNKQTWTGLILKLRATNGPEPDMNLMRAAVWFGQTFLTRLKRKQGYCPFCTWSNLKSPALAESTTRRPTTGNCPSGPLVQAKTWCQLSVFSSHSFSGAGESLPIPDAYQAITFREAWYFGGGGGVRLIPSLLLVAKCQ